VDPRTLFARIARGDVANVSLSDAVTTLLSALSYRTQSWSISMPFCGLYW
jgi:hypothetical protein